MLLKSKATKILSLLLAAIIALPVLSVSASSSSAPSTARNSTYTSYFNDIYPNLTDTNHVYESLTYHQLDYLLEQSGTYVILFGGAWDQKTQSVINSINEVAKQYGVTKVYNFDTRLDGKSSKLDITDSNNSPYSRRYVDLVNKYLTNLGDFVEGDDKVTYTHTTTGSTGKTNTGESIKAETPFLFVYNKDHKNGDIVAPIISALETTETVTAEGVVAYKQLVSDVFHTVSTNEKANTDQFNNQQYIRDSYNEFAAPDVIFDDSDGEIVIDPVTYDELDHILGSEGNYLVFFGCSWCPNTRAIAKLVNEYAKEHHIDKVYNFDTKLDGGIGGTPGVAAGTDYANLLQIRTNNLDITYLYTDLVNKHLNNLTTENSQAATPNIISYSNEAGEKITATRLQVPFLFAYNKDNTDASGNKAPILGHIELMYTWNTIQPNYVYQDVTAGPRNTYIQALNDLLSRVESTPNLSSVKPTSSANNDGQITGTNKALEYKLDGTDTYTAVSGDAITGLAPGTYLVRYASKNSYNGPINNAGGKVTVPYPAGKSVEIVIEGYGEVEQAAPTGLVGVKPTTADNNDGQITGTSTDLEYRLLGTESYKPATGTTINGLVPGVYQVRYAAKKGYSASPSVTVTVPSNGSVVPPTTQPPVVTTPENNDVDPKASTTVPATSTDEATGETIAVVTQDTVNKLKDQAKKAEQAGKSASIEFKVEKTAKTTSTQLTIPRAAFNGLASETNAVIKVDVGYGTVSFDAKAADSISAAAATGDISIIISKTSLTKEGKEVLGDRPVYIFSVYAGDTYLSSFGGGSVHINLPYTLQADEDPNAIIVYYVTDEDELQPIRGQYNAATQQVHFKTSHFSQYIIGYNKISFTDVSATAWYADAVSYLAARDIARGTDDSHYSPNAVVTRGQFIVLLLRAYGIEPQVKEENNFADAGNTYYTAYLGAAKRLGITTGIGNDKFAPNSLISRQELFTILYRALEVLGEIPTSKTGAVVSNFTDSGQIASYATDAFKAFVESGIITGDNAKLNPKGNSTRAEVAKVIYNLLSK